MRLFGKRYDAFISYKSRNVDTARLIADRIAASGKSVWFAEYQVLLVKRDRFQEAIDKGIRKSRYGIALTNDDYAGSVYCNNEMAQLLDACGPSKILEIMIPHEPETHIKYRQLKESPSHKYTGNADDALKFVAHNTGWKIVPRMPPAHSAGIDLFEGDCLGGPYSIDVSGWELVSPSFHGGGPCYVRSLEGKDLFWNLQHGEEFSREAYEARIRLTRETEDRLYRDLCRYANRYFSMYKPGAKVAGVHLLLMSGASHFAVTYKDGHFWKRRYSIMLKRPGSSKTAEFVFTFQFPGKFKDYCRCVEVMDNLVKTLEWQ